jgi:hypothetical protein
MQQVVRVSDFTAFFSLTENQAGILMEYSQPINCFPFQKTRLPRIPLQVELDNTFQVSGIQRRKER